MTKKNSVIPAKRLVNRASRNPLLTKIYDRVGRQAGLPCAAHAGLLSGYQYFTKMDTWIPDKFGLLAKFSGMTE